MLNYDAFKAYLDTLDVGYDSLEDEGSYNIVLTYTLACDYPIEMYINFDKENQGLISVGVFDIVRVKKSKLKKAYGIVNDLNQMNPFAKFLVGDFLDIISVELNYHYICKEDNLDCPTLFVIIEDFFQLLEYAVPELLELE